MRGTPEGLAFIVYVHKRGTVYLNSCRPNCQGEQFKGTMAPEAEPLRNASPRGTKRSQLRHPKTRNRRQPPQEVQAWRVSDRKQRARKLRPHAPHPFPAPREPNLPCSGPRPALSTPLRQPVRPAPAQGESLRRRGKGHVLGRTVSPPASPIRLPPCFWAGHELV